MVAEELAQAADRLLARDAQFVLVARPEVAPPAGRLHITLLCWEVNGEANVTGKAMAYTGAPIGGAKIRYRVTREVRWPMWF